MKIYCPNIKEDGIGGGWTFWRNFKKGMATKAHFVDNWQDCDIFFITSVTLVDKQEIHEAHKAGKKIVLRVDNVPRKSRNRRSSPHERLREFASLSDVVIYQSEWAKNYCYPICGDGTVIYNGVDQDVFFPKAPTERDPYWEDTYVFAYHGKNDHKGFWAAHYIFQMEARKNPHAHFYFIYDFSRETEELVNADFDFWNGEKFTHLDKIIDPNDMAKLLRGCKYLIYPSICDASPNIVLEARASGCEVIGAAPKFMSGTAELLDENLDISVERMCEEYFGVFEVALID